MPVTQGCTVRAATLAELVALAPQLASLPLLRAYAQTATTLTRSLQRAYGAGEGLLVACIETKTDAMPVGLAWYTARGGLGLAAYLRLLALLPPATGRGIGSALCAAFEAATQDARGGQLALCSATNQAALKFYAVRGYVQVGTLAGFVHPSHDEVLLHRPR